MRTSLLTVGPALGYTSAALPIPPHGEDTVLATLGAAADRVYFARVVASGF